MSSRSLLASSILVLSRRPVFRKACPTLWPVVAGLFVTKTVYAAIVAVGAAGITYPFFPRHLTIISTLTIGVPGFLLALPPAPPGPGLGSPAGC